MADRGPLERIIAEMHGAVDAGLNMVGLTVAVALPAICASLAMANGRAQGPQYLEWCRQNLYPDKGFNLITPEEMYSIRNGLLHQGRVEILNNSKGNLSNPHRLERGVFLVGPSGTVLVGCVAERQYVYSLREFCRNMDTAIHTWFEKVQANPVVVENLESMMQYRPFVDQNIAIIPPPQAIY